MRIVFMGTPEFAVRIMESLYDAGHEIVCAVSQPDKPTGRSHSALTPTRVKSLALSLGIPVLQPGKASDPDFIEEIEHYAPDVTVVAAYGRILTPRLLKIPRLGSVNVHASLLPRWRGAAPIQWAVISGDKETGVTTMLMDEGLDTGDILLTESTPISRGEDAGSLGARLSDLGAELIVRTLGLMECGGITPRPQPEDGVCYAPMLTKDMGAIDWTMDALSIERRVLGLNPWPGTFSYMGLRRIKILKALAIDYETRGTPGHAYICRERLAVETGGGLIGIDCLQPEGKKPMSARDFIKGYKIADFSDKRS